MKARWSFLLTPKLGSNLIVASATEEGHTIRLYDVRTPSFLPLVTAPHASGTSISEISLSPDEDLLAVARSGTYADVFDMRFLKQPLLRCTHETPVRDGKVVPKHKRWGICGMQWMPGTRGARGGPGPNVLVTGADDGELNIPRMCHSFKVSAGAVKVWDLRRSIEDTGHVIAQLSDAVGAMHLGDVYKGERPLIVYISSLSLS